MTLIVQEEDDLEILYFYDYDAKNDVEKALQEDLIKRADYTVRECKLLGSDREGYFLYLRGTPEMMKEVDTLFADLPLEKVPEKEARDIIEKIKAEDDSAATGMGMIFG